MVSELETRTDEEVAVLVQSGERELFGVLVGRYEEKLLRYGRKFLSNPEDVRDLVQDVFIRAYQNLQSFDPAQRFSPWLYRVAHNVFVNGLRKKMRDRLVFVDFDTFALQPVYEDPAGREREQLELKQYLEKGLSHISSKYREVLVLYYMEEMSYKDIAEVLQVPTNTIGIRLKRAREALRKVCGDDSELYA